MKVHTTGPFIGAARILAIALYNARAHAYGLQCPSWEMLSPETRDQWILRADEVLKTLDPTPVPFTPRQHTPYFDLALDLARKHAQVVGRISPEEPYGITES